MNGALVVVLSVLLVVGILGLLVFFSVRREMRAIQAARRAAATPRTPRRMPALHKISIIMPALNEQENIVGAIREVLAAFDSLVIPGEIVVVDDGSTDQTRTLATTEARADDRVRLIAHEKPAGIGTAFWTGLGAALGDAVCMLPGDNENDPREILRYHQLLEHVDILIPFVFNKQARSLFRNGLSYLYRFVINTTFLVHFNYTNGTIMYRRQVLEELDFHSSGFFFQTDILVRLVKRGYLFAEVPYRLDVRPGGASKAVSYPSLIRVVRGYLRLCRDVYLPGKGAVKLEFASESLTATRQGQASAGRPHY